MLLAIACSTAAQHDCQDIELNERTASRYRRLSKITRSHSIFEENHFPSPCLAGKSPCMLSALKESDYIEHDDRVYLPSAPLCGGNVASLGSRASWRPSCTARKVKSETRDHLRAGKANCSSPMPQFWSGFCTFKAEGMWTDHMICSPQKQAAILEYYKSRQHVPGFAELLSFTPCDLWPVIRSASDATAASATSHASYPTACRMSTNSRDDAASACRGRTLWLVGDSHMVDLFRALACAVGSFWDYNFKGDFPMAAEKDALEAMAEHVAHSTGPECLPLLEGTLVCLMRVNHGEVSQSPSDPSS